MVRDVKPVYYYTKSSLFLEGELLLREFLIKESQVAAMLSDSDKASEALLEYKR